ncbi:MAG: aldo/keto reductase [Terrimicrobiaceae bacterium]
MNTRLFGATGHLMGEIGLGCWQLGGTDWGALSDMKARSILIAAADSGVTFFDTADVYGNGRSEEILGRFLKERKGNYFVATKVGRAHGIYPSGYTWDAIHSATEASLKRLGVPALDLTQLHCVPTEVLREGEIFDWLRRLQAMGNIRHFGASVETVEEALICLEQPGLASLQVIFNVFRQKPARELFAIAKEKNVAVIVRLPLASGLLGGHLTGQTVFPADDHRSYNRDGQAFNVGETFCGLPFERGLELVTGLEPMIPQGMTLPQMALRYILDHDAVSVVIPGSSRPAQATSNATATKLPPLSPELHEQLRHFYENEVAPFIRGPY